MSYYFDTPAIVALLTPEPHSSRVDAWLGGHADAALMISAWVETEFAAALSAKLRAKVIPGAGRDKAITAFAELKSTTFGWLNANDAVFETATAFAASTGAGLKAGDALHLAFAAGCGATLCTLDKRQAEAGALLQVPALLL